MIAVRGAAHERQGVIGAEGTVEATRRTEDENIPSPVCIESLGRG